MSSESKEDERAVELCLPRMVLKLRKCSLHNVLACVLEGERGVECVLPRMVLKLRNCSCVLDVKTCTYECPCRLADAASQSFSGGNTGFWTGVSIEYCIFIGRSDNTGQPRTYTEKLDNNTSLTMTFPGTYGPSP